MKTYCITIQKGGTGKTAATAALAQAAAFSGYRVLAIDMDPQGTLSFSLKADTGKHGCLSFMEGARPETIIQPSVDRLDIIPAEWSLQTLKTSHGSAHRLQRALRTVAARYDYCFIDTPSTAGELQYNAFQAADALLVPLEAAAESLQGLYQTVALARQFLGLKVAGCFVTRYDGRSGNFKKQMAQETIPTQAQKIGVPFLGIVHSGARVPEAAGYQCSLYELDPKCRPAQDFLKILKQIL